MVDHGLTGLPKAEQIVETYVFSLSNQGHSFFFGHENHKNSVSINML
jgi:hypothetical protein